MGDLIEKLMKKKSSQNYFKAGDVINNFKNI